MLDSLAHVFKRNLVALRGSRSLVDIAQGAGIPYSTYKTYEATKPKIPSDRHLRALAHFFDVPVTRFFQDAHNFITPKEALKIVDKALDDRPLAGPLPTRLAAIISNLDHNVDCLQRIVDFAQFELDELFADRVKLNKDPV